MTASQGTQCFAYLCSNYRNAISKSKGISFHKFPSEDKFPKLYAAWVRNCQRDREPGKHCVLCSDHFAAVCFDRTGQIVRLRDGAVPTLFNLPPHLQAPCKGRTTENSTKADVTDILPQTVSSAPSCKDHAYSCSPRKWKRK
ncbi:PREDICTED: THAP domain-containing protein 2-like [Priapulus caudatus]|uniref:THAP domain-containing protein 2-like n=1 Tax=Priapulus caudatus TaxID=37621 RepID=A0ABM1EVU3_PRICU|nr:PREDICTED: THAP domain-containing protein 2-like [Priapulus caudatus]